MTTRLDIISVALSGVFTVLGIYLTVRGNRGSKRIDSVDHRIDTAFQQNDKTIERQNERIAFLEATLKAQTEQLTLLMSQVATLRASENDLRSWAVDATNWMRKADDLLRSESIDIERPPPFPPHRLVF